MTALDRDVTEGAFHVCRHDIDYTLRSIDRAHSSLRGSAHFRGEHCESCSRPFFVELKFAAEQCSAWKMTQHYMRIGDRWQQGLAIAGRPRIGAGRFWTDA